MKKRIIFGWVRIVFGLLIFALGVHLTIRADLGLAPLDCHVREALKILKA